MKAEVKELLRYRSEQLNNFLTFYQFAYCQGCSKQHVCLLNMSILTFFYDFASC